jgi:hypothetical protein
MTMNFKLRVGSCMELEEQSPEYLKQLVLSSLTICCEVTEDKEDVDPKGKILKWVLINSKS